jgi:hypothetical protein
MGPQPFEVRAVPGSTPDKVCDERHRNIAADSSNLFSRMSAAEERVAALEGALRGYKEINLRALRALAPGGLLATYVCSHHLHDADLRGVLADALAAR